MNKEFRCWNVEEKIMHDVAFPSWNGTVEVWENNKPQTKTQFLNLGGEEVGILEQFTGLKDKNRKKIFEGDILKAIDENYVGKVWLGGGSFYSDCGGFGVESLADINCRGVVVIGNIHESPELL